MVVPLFGPKHTVPQLLPDSQCPGSEWCRDLDILATCALHMKVWLYHQVSVSITHQCFVQVPSFLMIWCIFSWSPPQSFSYFQLLMSSFCSVLLTWFTVHRASVPILGWYLYPWAALCAGESFWIYLKVGSHLAWLSQFLPHQLPRHQLLVIFFKFSDHLHHILW